MGLVSSKCPECGASIKINDKATGKLTCPFCGSSYQAEDALKTKRSTIQKKRLMMLVANQKNMKH